MWSTIDSLIPFLRIKELFHPNLDENHELFLYHSCRIGKNETLIAVFQLKTRSAEAVRDQLPSGFRRDRPVCVAGGGTGAVAKPMTEPGTCRKVGKSKKVGRFLQADATQNTG